jgi:transposase InsO family protein
VTTTDSDHELEVYLNVASRMKLNGFNQLWVADITLKTEFVYLAVIMDAHSRKVVGWAIGQSLATRLPLELCRPRLRTGIRRQVWCTTRIAACSTLPATT